MSHISDYDSSLFKSYEPSFLYTFGLVYIFRCGAETDKDISKTTVASSCNQEDLDAM